MNMVKIFLKFLNVLSVQQPFELPVQVPVQIPVQLLLELEASELTRSKCE
jgi:hypothetical protein